MKELNSQFEDLGVLLEFAEADESERTSAELKQALDAIGPKLEAVELQATMADPSDAFGVYVAIQAGEGGTDSASWAEIPCCGCTSTGPNQGLRDRAVGRVAGGRVGHPQCHAGRAGHYAFGVSREKPAITG